jgi:hypothetical protein
MGLNGDVQAALPTAPWRSAATIWPRHWKKAPPFECFFAHAMIPLAHRSAGDDTLFEAQR